MELIDIVNENNELTGKVEERKIAHEKCLWHRHVSSWIMNEKGEILLQKRSADKPRNPNKWAKTGGHVDSGENVEDAIFREVKEEIGIEIPRNQIEIIEIRKSKDLNNKYFVYERETKMILQAIKHILSDEFLYSKNKITITA